MPESPMAAFAASSAVNGGQMDLDSAQPLDLRRKGTDQFARLLARVVHFSSCPL